VNQRSGLEGLAGGFVRHPGRGQLAQLFIDQREQFVGGVGIALLDGRQDVSHIAHGSVVGGLAEARYSEAVELETTRRK